jgi:hypothetical protein
MSNHLEIQNLTGVNKATKGEKSVLISRLLDRIVIEFYFQEKYNTLKLYLASEIDEANKDANTFLDFGLVL